MTTGVIEGLKALLVLVLVFLLVAASDRADALRKENAELKKQLEERPDMNSWGATRVMFHLLASENYRLGGEAKRWLPPSLVVPQEEIDHLLKNGWFYPNGVANGAIANPANVTKPDAVRKPDVPNKAER